MNEVVLKTGSSFSYLPSFGSRQRSLVTAKKSDPVSKSTLAGWFSDPKKIVPTYPAPSSFSRSTLKPLPAHEGAEGVALAASGFLSC